jgi:hypothetical protein
MIGSMRLASQWALPFTLVLSSTVAHPQSKKNLDPKLVRTRYSFSIHDGAPPLTFRVQVDDSSTITSVQVFQPSNATAFQTLPTCDKNLPMQLFEGDEQLALVEHADFNFDGYEDIELLQFVNDHLGKKIFCVYLWNPVSGRFQYEPQLFIADPFPHPDTKTITSHAEYFGGEHIDSTFRWEGAKLVLVGESGLVRGPKVDCGFVEYSRKLINGKMQTVDEKYTDCDEKPHSLP